MNNDLNALASANRIHIGFFGCRNAGKSSLVNAVTGQDLAVVSDIKGTTTDPVVKAMELLPLGPVVIIDTPGFDDAGMLGDLRVRKTKQILNRTDLAVLVVDETTGMTRDDALLLSLFSSKKIPHLIAFNKCDLSHLPEDVSENTSGVRDLPEEGLSGYSQVPRIRVSALTGTGVYELKEMIASLMPKEDPSHTVTQNLVPPGACAVLVCPIDKAAPKGRLIMPQQMTIRSIMDAGGMALITRESELPQTLEALSRPPAIVITDSQVFSSVSRMVPEEVPLTSFSILMARYKGFLETAVRAVGAIRDLKNHDRILMAEGCTHHRQCGDIGTVKIPGWLRHCSGADLEIETCSGKDFPEDLTPYAAVIHCGGCMITEREVMYRMNCANDQGVPFTNYGIVIAYMTGILERSLRVFPDMHALL
ncbi:MAG: [FeFe] hydrogenase H-cluster maturation GTPase HydF [Lachnospiraceae bacterium]|nr:[FeFe] hydrogenase H-cluster maturation GTPase HydF [Lachnospiraceae bacterium]